VLCKAGQYYDTLKSEENENSKVFWLPLSGCEILLNVITNIK
jgi:hypothetical protein